jgi:hypothetical protein
MEVETMRRITGWSKPRGWRKTIATLAALAGGTALTFGALPMSSASAGHNGQQVSYCPPHDAVMVKIDGINQNRQASEWISPVQDPGGCHGNRNVTWNWWWEGTIAIFYTHPGSDNWVFDRICEVPRDWYNEDVANC